MPTNTIQNLFTIPLTVKRLTPNSVNTDQEGYSILTTIYGHIQPARYDTTVMLEGKLFKTFNCWTHEYANVRENDIVIPSGAVDYPGEYIVQGVETWEMGKNPHKRLLIRQAVGS